LFSLSASGSTIGGALRPWATHHWGDWERLQVPGDRCLAQHRGAVVAGRPAPQ